jgi:hypothetical protein
MSEETTEGIAELNRLEWDLGAAARTKPAVHLVNEPPMPIQPGDWVGMGITPDLNNTCSADDMPHLDVIREKLRAKVKDSSASPEDRATAALALRIMYRETV